MGLLDRMEQRASPENPATSLANPDAWLWDAWGARPAASGVRISPTTALSLSAYFACIRVIAETLATLPKQAFERLDRGRRRRADHAVESLIDLQPNPEMDAIQFFEALQGHVSGWGNAFAEIETDGSGRPIALWPLLPDRTYVDEDRAGRKIVVTEVKEGQSRKLVGLPAHRVLHIHGLGFDGRTGYSVARLAREAIGLSLAAEEFGARFFSNGANMGLVATHPAAFKNPERRKKVREMIESASQGLKKAHRLVLLEEGIKLERLGIPQQDAQYIELRKFQVPEIARWFRMPLHKIQELDRATNNNIEHQAIEFVTDCMLPVVRRWELAINLALFAGRDRGRLFVKFNLEGLLRGDLKTRYDAYATGRQWGWLSPNDVREREDLNPLPTEVGDRYLYPQNMAPADRMDEIVEAQGRKSGAVEGKRANEADVHAAFQELLADALDRGVRREVEELRRLAGIWSAKRRGPEEIRADIAALYERQVKASAAQLEPLERAFRGVAPRGFASACAERQAAAAAEQLHQIIETGGDVAAAIETRLDQWIETRAATAARIEQEAIEAGRSA